MLLDRRHILVFLIGACGLTAEAAVDFATQVHPILAQRCGICHSAERRSGGLSLATYQDMLDGGRSGAAVRPGRGSESLLVQRINGSLINGSLNPRMPLGGQPLTDTEMATIRSWIDEGARATPTSAMAKAKWEAPLLLTHPPEPTLVWAQWNGPVDRYVSRYLADAHLAEPRAVDDRTFARRVYVDVWGLLPPPGELAQFVADRHPRKRQDLVARLLADNGKYSENWMSFWNDLLRNDEGVNYHSETASRKSISAWLLASLQANMAYDEMVRKLLNPANTSDPEGFLIGVNWRGTVSASQTPAMQAAQNTAQIFLGVNLKCNSCHDSFISKWKLKDAYALAAYFSPEDKLQLSRCDVAQQQWASAGFLYPELHRESVSNSLPDRRAAAAAIFTDPRNGRLARTLVNRVWLRLMGHGFVTSPDEMDEEPWSPDTLDALSGEFVAHGYDLKWLIGAIVSSRTYQMPSVSGQVDSQKRYAFRGPEVRRLTAEQMADAIGTITGEWHQYQPSKSGPDALAREWRVAANPWTRALGRPIRDQVYSARDTEATTLQALEVVNGQTLTHWLNRGAKRMLGQLPAAPLARLDRSLAGRNGPYSFDVDIEGTSKLWLVVRDNGSYSPEKLEPIWSNAELLGPQGAVPLKMLKPLKDEGLRKGGDGVAVQASSWLVYDLGSAGYTRLRGAVALENREITSDLNPQLRFLVFTSEPDPDRLTPISTDARLPNPKPVKTPQEAVDQVFRRALGRLPTAAERQLAEAAIRNQSGAISAEGLSDLLWAVLAKPEFQLIY